MMLVPRTAFPASAPPGGSVSSTVRAVGAPAGGVAPGGTGTEGERLSDRVGAALADEPSVLVLQQAAAALLVHQDRALGDLRRRARRAALAPDVRVHLSHSQRDQLTADTSPLGSSPQNRSWVIDATFGWSLDRLVFERAELEVEREIERRAVERRRVVGEVARLYYERRRLQLELLLRPPHDSTARALLGVRIDELGTALDELTDGAFSRGAPSSSRSGGGAPR